MKVFVSFDGDHIGRMVGRASLADNPEEISKIAQAIDRGNAVWRSWAESHGGKVINIGGDEGRLEVEADHLQELPKIRDQYASAVGSTVSVGVGTKLSEADKSLMAAKMQGGDRIQLYTEEVNELLEELQEQGEGAKLYDEYLDPEAGLQKAQPGMNQGGNAGFSGASRSQPAAPQAPTEGSEHSEAEVLRQELANAPSQPAGIQQGATDYEQLFHQAAAQSPEEEAQRPSGLDDGVRSQVVKILQDVRANAPAIAEMKQSNPELYNSIKGLVDAMIALAQSQDQQPQPVQKSEDAKPCKHFFGRGTKCLKCKKEKVALEKGWPKDEAENQANASSAKVYQDMMADRGQLQARSAMVDPKTGSQLIAPGEPAEEVPIVPDPGYKPMQPATNPKTGKVTVARTPEGLVGTRAAQERTRAARAANGRTLGAQGMESENARHGRQPPDVGSGEGDPQMLAHIGGLGDQMADVDAASRPLIPQYNGLNGAGVPDPMHFRWLHVPEGGSIVSTYGPQRDPGTYVTAHAGEDEGPEDDGPLIGVYRHDPTTNTVSEVPIADQRDPNSGLRVSGGKYVYQNMPLDLPPRLNREQWSSYGTSHGNQAVLQHIHQALTNPNFTPPAPSPEAQWHAQNAAATAEGRRGVPVRTEEQQKALANKDNTLAAMQARARALGLIKEQMEKASLEAGKTGRHQVVLPVGAQIDSGPSAAHEAGEIKVRDPETQKTKWRSVRSGLVMAPDGTPTSSRNPSGS